MTAPLAVAWPPPSAASYPGSETYALDWVILTSAFTVPAWLLHAPERTVRLGLWRTVDNPRPGDQQQQSTWARRGEAGHDDTGVNLPSFVALAVVAVTVVASR